MSTASLKPLIYVSIETKVIPTVQKYYPALTGTVRACLAVFGAMSLKDRRKPLSLILETPSGYGKTAVLQMTFPISNTLLSKYVYRSDKFTPKSFVSHAANVKKSKIGDIDLLPRLRDKVLVSKELAPIFRGKEKELEENFSMLISVLDGTGFTSDSGMRGRRGYEEQIVFNWIGATTPLPKETHRLMSQLGTRLLFYEVPIVEPTEEELLEYAENDTSSEAETECNRVVNQFLMDFFAAHPVGSIEPDSIEIPKPLLNELVQWAKFLTIGRREVKYENDGLGWDAIVAATPEGPWKVINYFKELARGHALIHGRTAVTEADLELVGHVAISSIPAYLRPIIHRLRDADSVSSAECTKLCRVSRPTARKHLRELELLEIVEVAKGSPETNEPDTAALSEKFRWIRRP